MPSPFDALMAGVDAACEATFGEGVTISPRVAGNYGFKPDSSRPTRAGVSATVSISPIEGTPLGQNATGDGLSKGRMATVAESEIWFSTAAYASIGYELKGGDLIILTARPGSPRYCVERPAKTDLSDVAFIVSAERKPPA